MENKGRLFILFWTLWLAGISLCYSQTAWLIKVKGPIGPATSDYIHTHLAQAQTKKTDLIILQMDTPGGLDTSMRVIIQDILASTIPVVTYVSPQGARAASAGTYILYASHIAAMAPGTNLGAATPVQMGGMDLEKDESKEKADNKTTLEHKQINDAVAYIRGLAQLRQRNVEWAVQAVQEAASLSAEEAYKLGVIDLIAKDVPELLHKIDGKQVLLNNVTHTINTQGLQVIENEPNWRNQLLAIITDPNIAYILMLVGIYGLIYELANPGALFPGVVGGICLILALYAFQVLPVNYAGVALILLGLGFMTAEAFVTSFGVLGLSGLIAFVIGSIILFDTTAPGFQLSLALIASFALLSILVLSVLLWLVLKSQRGTVIKGLDNMVGLVAEALESFNQQGQVRVRGELWQAKADRPIVKGQKLEVIGIDGLTLKVKPEHTA